MTYKPPINIIHYRRKGWLKVGRTRMVLFDIVQGFYNLRKVIRREVGDNASYLIFQAGIKGGISFLGPMIRAGRIAAAGRGFLEGLAVFTDGGFGHFQIQEMDWQRGWARILCHSSVEGWVYARKRRHGAAGPLCDYSRGIILGFMKATHHYARTGLEDTLDCIETACLAAGARYCEFMIGTHDHLRELGREGSRPGKSIQELLKERVQEKTREIREANRFNERILRNAPVGILTLDARGRVTSANPAAGRVFGVSSRRLLGRSLEEDPEGPPSPLRQYLARGLTGERFELVDLPLRSRGRRTRYISVKGIPLKSPRGAAEGLLCIMEDTTDKTLNAQQVEYLKTYNENIIQSIADGIMVLDPGLRIQTWNRKMEEIFRISAANVLGRSVREVPVPAALPDMIQGLKEVIRTGRSVNRDRYRFRSADRGPIVLNLKIIPLFDEQAAVSGIIIVHEDITARERIEIRYRNLFEAAQDGICLTDLKGRVVSANQRVLQTLDISWQDLKSTSLERFLPPGERARWQESLTRATRGEQVDPCELDFVSTSGRLTPVELSITAVRAGERIMGLQIIGRDITARKKMEQHMIEAGKLAAVGELASGVAHEINNPLASVAGYAEEALDLIGGQESLGSGDVVEVREALATIIEQAQRCKEITQSLLNFARQGQFQILPTDLNELVEKTLLLMEPELRSGKVRVIKKLRPGLPLVETDPSQVQQVFLNVLRNALDAVSEGGRIRVATGAENGRVIIRFSDNGAGIPEAHLKKIFNPFFTTKPPGRGTGLGLSICYSILQRLKGRIQVESRVTAGTTFKIVLPQRYEEKGERTP